MILWQAKLDDYGTELLTDEDCDELCNALQDFWDDLIGKKLADVEAKQEKKGGKK